MQPKTVKMNPIKLVSKARLIVSLSIAAVFVFVAMNFNPRNMNILATRSLGRIILDYALNILLFFVVIYFVLSAATWLYRKIFRHTDQ